MNKIQIILAVLIVAVVGFFALNSFIYNEKQGENLPPPPTGDLGEPPFVVPDFEGEADPSRMTLGMTTWNWVSTVGSDGATVTPLKPNTFTLTFSNEGRLSATTDCNSMGASYTATKNTISVGPIAMTKMFCQDSQEMEIAKILENVESYQFTSRGELKINLKTGGVATFR